MASSTLALRESSLARRRRSWAGDNSNSMPVILLANACKWQTNVICLYSETSCLNQQSFIRKKEKEEENVRNLGNK